MSTAVAAVPESAAAFDAALTSVGASAAASGAEATATTAAAGIGAAAGGAFLAIPGLVFAVMSAITDKMSRDGDYHAANDYGNSFKDFLSNIGATTIQQAVDWITAQGPNMNPVDVDRMRYVQRVILAAKNNPDSLTSSDRIFLNAIRDNPAIFQYNWNLPLPSSWLGSIELQQQAELQQARQQWQWSNEGENGTNPVPPISDADVLAWYNKNQAQSQGGGDGGR